MVLLSIAYNKKNENIIVEEIKEIKEIFEVKNVKIGVSESIDNDTHFVKFYCNDNEDNENIKNTFNLYFANSLYKLVVDKFYKTKLDGFISDNYFFLKMSEVKKIKLILNKALICEGQRLDPNTIYYINRKNDILKKIIECIKENDEMNIDGFLTFRLKEFEDELECIVEKVIEGYMVEKEYDEFIKLLKYFVEVQDSKIDEVNIIINNEGEYKIVDKKGDDILHFMMSGLSEAKVSGAVNIEDIIISGLITNAPKRVIIHGYEYCRNNEMVDTIKNVFLDRVSFCEGCDFCKFNSDKQKLNNKVHHEINLKK